MPTIRFVPFSEEHLPHVAAMLDDPEVLRFTRVPDPPPEDFARTWLERYEQGRREGTRDAWAALDADGEFVGLAMAPSVNREGLEAEVGYMVAPAARGRGVARAMLEELTRWAFEEAGMLRVTLLIDLANAASLQVARRCGYFHEGTMRSAPHKNGIRIDVTIWSRLPTDP